MTLDDFERYFTVKIPAFEQSGMLTLAGFMAKECENPIKIGQAIKMEPFLFEIIDYEQSYINCVKVTKK